MIALEHRGSVQMNGECLLNRVFPDHLKGFQERKDSQLHGDFLESQRSRCSAFYPETANLNAFKGQFQHSSMDSRFCYPPVNGICQFQDFQYFFVIDFEATCDKEKIPQPQEIIEFPSVIVNSVTGELEACFQTYVRPTYNQQLTDFCKDLTGIQQDQVDTGVTLSEALLSHDKWLEKKGTKKANFAVVTWSNWDCRVMLESECQYKKIRKPSYLNRWINLRIPFREVFGGVRCNLKQAVEIAGLNWHGRAHCGLDDAKNTARLLALLMRRGVKLSITDSLTDESFTRTQQLENQSFPLYQPDQKVKTSLHPHCFCGVKSGKGMVRKPGSEQGILYFGCGNWTAARGARCHYFQLATV